MKKTGRSRNFKLTAMPVLAVLTPFVLQRADAESVALIWKLRDLRNYSLWTVFLFLAIWSLYFLNIHHIDLGF